MLNEYTPSEQLAHLDRIERNLGRAKWVARFPCGDDETCLALAAGGCGSPTYELLCDVAGAEHGYLSRWNDAPGRTFDDVKKLLADARARILSSANEGAKP